MRITDPRSPDLQAYEEQVRMDRERGVWWNGFKWAFPIALIIGFVLGWLAA